MEGKKLDDQDFNHFIIQTYKLSKRKEAALDDDNAKCKVNFRQISKTLEYSINVYI